MARCNCAQQQAQTYKQVQCDLEKHDLGKTHLFCTQSRKLFALDADQAQWDASLHRPQHPADTADDTTPPTRPRCHSDPGCKLLHSTAHVQLEFVLQAEDQDRCGMDAGRRGGKHALACVQGSSGRVAPKSTPWWRMWTLKTQDDQHDTGKSAQDETSANQQRVPIVFHPPVSIQRAPIQQAHANTKAHANIHAPPTVPSVTPALRAPPTNHSNICTQPRPAVALRLSIGQQPVALFGPPNALVFPANLTTDRNATIAQPLNTLPPKPRHVIAREAGGAFLRVASGAVGKRALLQRLRGGGHA